VKDVDLPRALHARGIVLPPWTLPVTKAVDIATHDFDVALSFLGDVRPLVEQVAKELESRIGPNSYFYDNNYVSQLARTSHTQFGSSALPLNADIMLRRRRSPGCAITGNRQPIRSRR
jgi:hypothetical protein